MTSDDFSGDLSKVQEYIDGLAKVHDAIEYTPFVAARSRCNNANHHAYRKYGGRGISFCFDTFAEFLLAVGRRPSKEYTLDRINNDGNYEKGNVRWATKQQQSRNQSTNQLLTFNGQIKTIAEWSECLGLKYITIWARLKKGWSTERCLTKEPWDRCVMREYNGQLMNLAQIAKLADVSHGALWHRVKAGQSVEFAIAQIRARKVG
jgi:hypothetical protein